MPLVPASLRGKLFLPLFILASGSMLSMGLGIATYRAVHHRAEQRFDIVALDISRKVEDRFDAYTDVLVGLRALLNTAENINRKQFRQYVDGLAMSSSYPGFQVLNYAPYVTADAKPAFERWLREDAGLGPNATERPGVTPEGVRPYYHPFAFVEPLTGNERVIGKDLSTLPEVKIALEQARDTGGLTTSGRKIRINGRDTDIGLAMRLPAYRPGMPLETVEQRRAAYLGSVGAGFRVADMMRDIIGSDEGRTLRLKLYNAGPSKSRIGTRETSRMLVQPMTLPPEQLIFDSSTATRGVSRNHEQIETGGAIHRQLSFDLGGQRWLVSIDEDIGAFLSPLDRSTPWVIFFFGMALTVLINGVVVWLLLSRSRAESRARVAAEELRHSERQLEDAQRLATLGSWSLDVETGALFCSDEAAIIFGIERGQPATFSMVLQRVPADERPGVELQFANASLCGLRSEFEHRIVLGDGSHRWVHTVAQATTENNRVMLHGTVRDDTQAQRGVQRLQVEHQVARLLVSDGEPEWVMAHALEAVGTHLGWDCGAFWGIDETGAVRCNAAWFADSDATLEQFIRISRSHTYRADEGSLGRAWASGKSICLDTATLADGQAAKRDLLAQQAGLATALIVPMSDASHLTALEFHSRRARSVDPETLESLRAVALHLAQYEQRKRSERALRYVTSRDALTGLPNRSTLQRDLTRAIKRSSRQNKRLSVMFVDIDRFKRINDSLGHGAGDAVIKTCAARLSSVLREDDVIARFGGDEFVLVLEHLTSAADAAIVADKVLATCAEPFIVDGHELHVTASVGMSVYPEDGADAESLLKNADAAMYRAKEKGRGAYEFYAAQMNAQGTERLMLESGLRRAIERGELEMHYQPKMNLHSRAIVGVEALMRWRHPEKGLVSPANFIPIAEDTGLIVPMGKWALQVACAEAKDWQARGLPPVQMSVNLSPRQFSSPTLIADIAAALESSGLDPSLLELEITETAMMANPEQAAALLQGIRDLGVSLAIDDFGTGYSSLSYLKRFPLSTVKIDRSFVNDISHDTDSQALIDGIVHLAHGLRMKVIAEGVETQEQLDYLRSRGCDEIQGYLLCKPQPSDDVCAFMSRHLRTQFAAPIAAA